MEKELRLDIRKDVERYGRPGKVVVRQGEENSTRLAVWLREDGVPYDLTGYEVELYLAAPGGSVVCMPAAISNATQGIVSIALPKEAASKPGVAVAYFAIRADAFLETTESFVVRVEESIDITEEQAEAYVARIDELVSALEAQRVEMKDSIAAASGAADKASASATRANEAAESASAAAADALLAAEEARESIDPDKRIYLTYEAVGDVEYITLVDTED